LRLGPNVFDPVRSLLGIYHASILGERVVETTRKCLFHFERIDGVVTPGCIDRSAFLGRWLRSGQTLGAQAYQQIRTFAKYAATQRIARLV
jgi:hypothetical protein